MNSYRIGILLLRVGVAFAFLYPPVSAIFEPYSWLGYVPQFTRGIVPDLFLLHVFGIFEVLIAVWILSGIRIFYPSLLAATLLCLIVICNMYNFEVVFRDLSIAAAAFTLALLSGSESNGQKDKVYTS